MSSSQPAPQRFTRPPTARRRPIRTAGTLFRTPAEGEAALGGLPLSSAEDAVVAAVRMAYRVAETQLDRSNRLAQRLREAGDRAVGARSDRKAVDATEQLVFRSMMAGLSWMEAAAEDESPLRRLMSAQYRMVGDALGLGPMPASKASDQAARPAKEGVAAGHAPQQPSPPAVKVVLKGAEKRAVRVRSWEVGGVVDQPVQFFSVEDLDQAPLEARVSVDEAGAAALAVEPRRTAARGLWRAAVCDAADVQVGIVEIEL